MSDLVNHQNEYMIAKNFINHDLFLLRPENIIEVLEAIKGIQIVTYDYATPASVLNAWLNSVVHKTNIKGNFLNCGILYVKMSRPKKNITQIFL